MFKNTSKYSVLTLLFMIAALTGCLFGSNSATTSTSTIPVKNNLDVESMMLSSPAFNGLVNGVIIESSITFNVPYGVHIESLSAIVYTGESTFYGESLSVISVSQNTNIAESRYTVTLTNPGADTVLANYVVTVIIPGTLFSCIPDNSGNSSNSCGCLLQNDGSGQIWYAQSMLPGNSTNFGSLYVAQNYLDTVMNKQMNCSYNDWRIPVAEATDVYYISDYNPNGSPSYYLWQVFESDTTDIGKLGFFAANNLSSDYFYELQNKNFIDWLNSGPPVTPTAYSNNAVTSGIQALNYILENSALTSSILYFSSYNGFVINCIGTSCSGGHVPNGNATLLPVRGGNGGVTMNLPDSVLEHN